MPQESDDDPSQSESESESSDSDSENSTDEERVATISKKVIMFLRPCLSNAHSNSNSVAIIDS